MKYSLRKIITTYFQIIQLIFFSYWSDRNVDNHNLLPRYLYKEKLFYQISVYQNIIFE
jgi:hypothetical protein